VIDWLRRRFERLLGFPAAGVDEGKALRGRRGQELAADLLSASLTRSRLRTVLIAALSALVVIVVVLLDLGGESDLAGHIVDLAKFVIPTLFASDAVIRYGESRLVCCVLDRQPVASRESEPETAPEQR
jgi:hypothetical protein